MEQNTKKRVVWFAVFMIWIGMVAAILIYQEISPSEVQLPSSTITGRMVEQPTVTPTNPLQVQTNPQVTANEKSPVVKEEKSAQDFFVQYRLERDKARSEQINIFRDVINNPNTDQAVKKAAQESLLRLTKDIEQEMEVESLIRARGYQDALAYKHESNIDLIIQTPGLNEADLLKIGDIIIRVTNLRTEDITIIEKRTNN